MLNISKLKNGLTVITIPRDHFESVTSLVVVGAGSRYENKKINGISHFLEHMFFKGSKKYPSAQILSSLVDGIGAINNASTSKEWTDYWIKSAANHLELGLDILSSQIQESLFASDEIEREKGVIIEEMRMVKDDPSRYVFDLFESLVFGDQPLGWEIIGTEEVIKSLKRQDFINYINSLYSPKNMVLVLAGKLPKDVDKLVEKYFSGLPSRDRHIFTEVKEQKLTKSKLNVFYKDTDQVNLIIGVKGFNRYDPKRYPARVLAAILGEGMSSRLFIQVRERRGLAYSVSAWSESFIDTGIFAAYAGLKLEKVDQGLKVILDQFSKVVNEKVSDRELKKAKELIKGRLAIRSESTNFLAEYFGINYILDGKVETFEEYINKIEAVTAEDLQEVAKQLFGPDKFYLQVIGPFKDDKKFKTTVST